MLLIVNCVLLLLPLPCLCARSFNGARDRRSDDVSMGMLEVLVQQQSALIQSLQAKVTALETTVSDLKTRVSQEEDRLGRVQQAVAFTATLFGPSTQPTLNVGDNAAIKFNDVITNIGNNYDPSTGTFTATVVGVYAFSLSLEADDSHDTIVVMVEKIVGGTGSAIAYTSVQGGGGTDHYDTSSIFVLTHLAAGDKVIARRAWGGNYLQNWLKNSFSGFLVSAD